MSRKNKQEYLKSSEKLESTMREDEIDLSQIFSTLWEKRWLIISSGIAGALIALLIALLLTPVFTGRGTLIIKQGQNSTLSNFMSGSGGLAGALLGNANGSNIQNEIKIMESRAVAERMADALIKKPLMENGRMYPIIWEDWPSDSVIIDRRNIVDRLLKQIEYTLTDRTTIIEVVNESPSPYEAVVLSNLAMQTYQDLSLEQSQDLTGTTAEYLADEQIQLQDSLARSEKALRDYMQKNEVVEIEAQTEQQIQQYAEMTGKRYEAQAQLEAANAAIDEYQERLNSIKPGLAEKLANAIGSTIKNLQFQISELETERALIYSRNPQLEEDEVPPPEIIRINKQLNELQQRVQNQTRQILQSNDEYLGLLAENSASVITTINEYTQKLIELRIERLQYSALIKALNDQIAEKDQFFDSVPENSLQMARLKRQAEVMQEIYLLVTKQLAQARFQAKSEMANSKILDKAILPLEPSFPNYLIFLVGGLLLGGFLATFYAFALSFMNDTVNNAQFLKRVGYQVIEIENSQNSPGVDTFAEVLISKSQNRDRNTHALLPADKNSKNTDSLLSNTIATINTKSYSAIGISTTGISDISIGENENSNIIGFGSLDEEKRLDRMIFRKAREADVVIVGGLYPDGKDNSLSIVRLCDRAWIIAEAGSTTLGEIQKLQSNINAINDNLEGIILLYT